MGWPLVRLDSLYNIARGGSPRPIKDFITDDPEGINWIKIGDATASGKYIYTTKQKIKPEGIQRSRLVKENDFLLSNSMSFGRPYIMGTTGCIHDGWLVLSAKDKQVDQDFLYHLLGSPFVFRQFDSLAAGSTVRNLNIDLVSGVKIPLIPIPEQQRIVTILDQAFADIEKARANAEKNLKNARELFDSYLNQEFSQRGEGWVENKLEDVCILQRGFDLPTRLREKGTHPLVSSSGATDLIDQYKVCGPGVVTGRSGSIGKVFYIEDDFWPLNTTLYIKEFHGNDKAFVFWLLKHFDLSRFTSGAGVPTLNRNSVHNELVWLPRDIATQKRIVKSAEILESKMNQLTTLYNDKKDALDELKKSLLQKAFSGELTKDKGIAA